MDQLPQSWTEGLVSIIYKEKGDSRDLRNWRPITLLNCDYKIFTKVITNRMKKVVGKLVNGDQSCGVPNRSIVDQLYYIDEFTKYYNERNKRGMMVCLDQEKCFDRIDHRLMFLMLEKYNFGDTIISFVKTIYRDMKSRIKINGYITEAFPVTRSVRQGDSLSMVLAVLIEELLAEIVRQNQEISTIILSNTKPKSVAQYADDTSVLTDNPKCLDSLWGSIRQYERLTGAKINDNKTEILLVGRWSKKEKMKIPKKYLGLAKERVKVLGVYFGKESRKENKERTILKIDKELGKWKDKNLSMNGRIAILTTLAVSKIWHWAKVQGVSEKFIRMVNSKMSSFFW